MKYETIFNIVMTYQENGNFIFLKLKLALKQKISIFSKNKKMKKTRIIEFKKQLFQLPCLIIKIKYLKLFYCTNS